MHIELRETNLDHFQPFSARLIKNQKTFYPKKKKFKNQKTLTHSATCDFLADPYFTFLQLGKKLRIKE